MKKDQRFEVYKKVRKETLPDSRPHKTVKSYTRKKKHKKNLVEDWVEF